MEHGKLHVRAIGQAVLFRNVELNVMFCMLAMPGLINKRLSRTKAPHSYHAVLFSLFDLARCPQLGVR